MGPEPPSPGYSQASGFDVEVNPSPPNPQSFVSLIPHFLVSYNMYIYIHSITVYTYTHTHTHTYTYTYTYIYIYILYTYSEILNVSLDELGMLRNASCS